MFLKWMFYLLLHVLLLLHLLSPFFSFLSFSFFPYFAPRRSLVLFPFNIIYVQVFQLIAFFMISFSKQWAQCTLKLPENLEFLKNTYNNRLTIWLMQVILLAKVQTISYLSYK
jgi:hypothetical protein